MFHRLLSPNLYLKVMSKCNLLLICTWLVTFSLGIYLSLFGSPEDYQQGDMVRIMYIHVPSAWMSLMIYSIMGFACIGSLIWRSIFGVVISIAAAPIGFTFAIITLVTGMIWGKPIWGTWWVWDARLTSMLILALFYAAFLMVANASDNIYKLEKPVAVIAVLGLINVPIVKFSVNLWYSLHQPASVIRMGAPAIHSSMLTPLLVMFLASLLLFFILLYYRVKTLLNIFSLNLRNSN